MPIAEAPDPRPRGGLGHEQFAYSRSYPLFFGREGYGPLLVALDTNILIDLTAHLDEVEAFGFGHVAPQEWEGDRIAALADFVAVWFWRDVRIHLSQLVLKDARTSLSEKRMRSRLQALEGFEEALWMRGGLPGQTDRGRRSDQLALFDDPQRSNPFPRGMDGVLVRDAVRHGAHVFLTEDRGVLSRSSELRRTGIAVLNPAGLLSLLYHAGEFSEARFPTGPAPDLISLSHFYRGLAEPTS